MHALKAVVAKVLGVDPSFLVLESSPKTIASWDSMAGLKMITVLETEYHVEFTMDEVLSVKKFGDIADILRLRGLVLIPD